MSLFSALQRKPGFWLVCLLLIAGLLLTACGGREPEPPAGQTPQPALTQPPASSTPPPTVTPTAPPSLVILYAAPDADPDLLAAVEPVVSELASQAGLRFETRAGPLISPLPQDVRMLIALPPDPGLTELAAANPGVSFLAVGVPGLQPAANLTLIGAEGERPDQQGFLAGYLAAVITPDWRVGVVSAPETPAVKAARSGFTNGAVFYCGLCRPAYPPFVQYPFYIDLPATAGQPEYQALADALVANAVKTTYVSPGISDPLFYETLALAGLQVLGEIAPPPGATGQWVASIGPDWATAVRQAWPGLLDGQGGQSLPAPVGFSNANPALFSPGRQDLVRRMLDDLLAGFIDTGIDPQTGEPR